MKMCVFAADSQLLRDSSGWETFRGIMKSGVQPELRKGRGCTTKHTNLCT